MARDPVPSPLPKPAALGALCAWGVLLALLLAPLAFGLGSAEGAGTSPLSARRLGRLAGNSLRIAAIAAVAGGVLGCFVGLVAARLEGPRRRLLLLGVAAAPLFIPPPVVAVAAIRLFGPSGLFADWIPGAGGAFPVVEQLDAAPSPLRISPVYTLEGGGLVLAWALGPLAALAAAAAAMRLPREPEEAALLETGPLRVLARVSLPALAGSAVTGAALVFLFAVNDFGVAESLRSLPVLVSEVYVQFGVYYDTTRAMGAGLVMAAMALAGAWAAERALFRDHGGESFLDEDPPPALGRSPGGRVLRAVAWLLALLAAGGIIGALAMTATGPMGPGAVWRQTWRTARPEFLFSLQLAAAMLPILGAASLALGAALASSARPRLWRLLVAAPLVLPGPVLAVGFLGLLRRPPGSLPLGLDDALAAMAATTAPLMIAWMLKFAPIGALLVERALRSAPRDWAEAAAMDGGGAWALWRAGLAARMLPALAAGALAGAAFTLGETGAAVLLIPPGTTTLGVRLQTLMHFSPAGEVSALSILLAGPGLLLAAAGALLLSIPALRSRAR